MLAEIFYHAGLAKDREKGYPEKELRLPLW